MNQNDNEKNFQVCKEIGEYYQDKITDALFKEGIILNSYVSKEYQKRIGENRAGIEIKHDSKIMKTGNLFIEVEAISKDLTKMVKGGIMYNDRSWLYLIGDDYFAYLFAKKQLINLYQKVKANPELYKEKYGITIKSHIEDDGTTTSKGMIIPVASLDSLWICLKKFKL